MSPDAIRPAIRVDQLGKRYRLGVQIKRQDTVASAVLAWLRSPFDNLRDLRSLGHFDDTVDPSVLWALQDVSFTVGQGEVLGVIGHNGAGKSTLLKILSRITPPSTGRVILNGRVSSLIEVGTGFHPDLTGRENIYLNGTILGMTKGEVDRKFDEIVAFAEVEPFIDTPVKRYSSGMRVRLAFAVSAHLEPEILLVDEVLAVGDAAFQKKCLGKMGEVAVGGKTVFFVSHNMNAVQRLCSKAVVLQKGLVISEGSVEPTISQYLNLEGTQTYAAGFSLDLGQAERTGNRFAEFRSVKISGTGEFGEVLSQDAIEVDLEIWSDDTRSVGSIAIYFSDLHGVKLINADTVSQGVTVLLKPGFNSLRFRVDSVHLVPGTYALGLWLAQSQSIEVFDHIPEAALVGIAERATEKQLGIQANGLVPCKFQVELLDVCDQT